MKSSLRKINWRRFGEAVIGIDEVGRGCLAGPVGAAACLFMHGKLEKELTDSKLLTHERRVVLSEKIIAVHPVSVAYATVEEIDEINILRASHLAMRRALASLEESLRGGPLADALAQAHIVVDGHMHITDIAKERQTPIIKGDLRCAPVSAASIVAKVARDARMRELHEAHPLYGFDSHKGYATAQHETAIKAHGPTAIHRKSFAGVKEFFSSEV